MASPARSLCNVGPTGTAMADGLFYGDIPKVTTAVIGGVSTPISIVSGLIDTTYPTSVQTAGDQPEHRSDALDHHAMAIPVADKPAFTPTLQITGDSSPRPMAAI